jgi:segregation and condensation protein B
MEISTIILHIEALIFASEKPLTTLELVDLVNNALGFIDDRANLDQVESAIEGIREKYSSEFYAFEMRESGGGWQFLTKKEYHKTVSQLNGEKFLKRLSVAALETLAIIAYKQPITKSEIETIRGVNCDYAVQKLLEKELVVIAGRNEEAVGKPLIYTTSKSFMDYFGINGPEDLPKIREVLMEEMVEATRVQQENPEENIETRNQEEDDNTSLHVNEQGEIVFNTPTIDSEDSVAEVAEQADASDELGDKDFQTLSEEAPSNDSQDRDVTKDDSEVTGSEDPNDSPVDDDTTNEDENNNVDQK